MTEKLLSKPLYEGIHAWDDAVRKADETEAHLFSGAPLKELLWMLRLVNEIKKPSSQFTSVQAFKVYLQRIDLNLNKPFDPNNP